MNPTITLLFIVSFWLREAITSITGFPSNQTVSAPREDHSSCTWEGSETEGLSIVCDQVPIATIQEAFSQTRALDLASIKIVIAPSEMLPIPDDFLGSSRAKEIFIVCNGSLPNLIIDDDAFRSSKSFTTGLSIHSCDLKNQSNFAFISDFQSLGSITIDNSRNFNSFKGIPSQSRLEHISILNSRGFENLEDGLKIELPNLKKLYLMNDTLNDEEADKILEIFGGSSKEILVQLKIAHNRLTRVPDIVTSFTKLAELRFENNAIEEIKSQKLALAVKKNVFLHLAENNIFAIEPNAFGDGKYSIIQLQKNNLTRFDSFVFQVVLKYMAKSAGILLAFENPFECDCHLAWLIVHNRHLLPAVQGAQCTDSTLFTDLKPENFRNCRVFACPVGIDGNFPNPLSCSSYYRCSSDGKSLLLKCPKGRRFSPSKQMCVSSERVATCR